MLLWNSLCESRDPNNFKGKNEKLEKGLQGKPCWEALLWFDFFSESMEQVTIGSR
jgi:hypothetical protein